MVYEECSVGEVVRVYPDLNCGGGGGGGAGAGGGGGGVVGGVGSVSWWGGRRTSSKAVATPPPSPSPPTAPPCCSFNTIPPTPSPFYHHLHKNMTIVSQQPPDVVRVAVGERGVVGSGCLLSAMSGVEAPPEAAPSPPPSPPHPAHYTAHDDDLPVTTTNTVVSSSEPVPQVLARSRRKLENVDSSYDSDFEPCEWTPASPRPEDDQHYDVCRTVSDTLGAEFAEYVTIKHNNPPPPATSIITSSDSTTPASLLPSSLTTHVITSSTTTTNSSNVDVVTAAAAAAAAAASPSTTSTPITSSSATTTTTPSTNSDTATTTVTISTTSITTPTSVTTTTITTVSTTSVTSGTGTKLDQGNSVRATSPAVRLPSSSPPTSSVGPPSLSITPPAPVTATSPPIVTLTQALPTVSISSSSTYSTSTSSCSSSSSSSTPAVTITSEITSPSSSLPATSASSSDVAAGVSWVVQHSGYASQVEFGVKLGYSENLVQLALVKLGGTPDKDELLAELIRLGTSIGRPEGDGDAPDDGTDVKDDAEPQQQQPALKHIIIDGSNVAMRHGNKTVFSCRGLRICVDWFRTRGHNEITVFVPAWRKEAPRWDTPIKDQEILLELEQENVLVFTPSRVCGGKRIVSYDDRYILNEAVANGGIVVSNDNYRDLAAESQAFRKVIEESLLMYSWVNGRFVPPDDPLGRNGPTLDAFLKRTPKDRQAPCPYGRKCTYGNKCKYMHPERGTAPLKSVTERLQEQAQRHYQKKASSRDSSPGEGLRGKSLSLPVGITDPDVSKKPLQRTKSNVPSVALTLPSSLTQETPTHDLCQNTTASTASHTRHLMPPQLESHPLDPLRSSTLFKSESSLYHLYPSQGPQASFGSSTWGWESQSTMPNPQGGPPHSQPQNYGAHMPVTKNLSDPDSVSSENPHKKLQRQLTLNPAFDSRLYKIVGFKEPAPELFPMGASLHQQSQQQQQQQAVGQVSPSRSGKHDSENLVYSQVPGGITGRVSPGYSSQFGSREQLTSGIHPPLTRHKSSQDGAKHMTSLPGHLYPPYSHPHVTRFASAPDPIWGGHQQQTAPGPPHITRLNSTSDTRLNLYGCSSEPQFISEVYDDQMAARLPPFHPAATHHSASPVPGAPSPGPIGSRPMSPQQGPVLHRSSCVSSRQHKTSQQHLSSQQTPSFPNPITGASHEDTRLRVYYHLSNLFPEAQVRAVLAMYPDETDPQKICTSILSHPPGPVGSRPMSPQQPSQSAVSHQPQNVPVRGSSPLNAGFSNPLPAAASSHEDARLRAFYHLSQLFPEAQVRAVLARFPDETDAQNLCATLIGLSGNQS